MSIEEQLERLTLAVQANTEAVKANTDALKAGGSVAPAGAATEAKKDDKKAADKKKGPTVDEVRAALKSYGAIEGKEAAIKIIKDHGADSVSEIDPAKFQAVLDAIKAAEA